MFGKQASGPVLRSAHSIQDNILDNMDVIWIIYIYVHIPNFIYPILALIENKTDLTLMYSAIDEAE